MYFSKPCGSCHVSQFGCCRRNLSFHRSSDVSKRAHRIVPAAAPADFGIINRLIGSPLLQLDHNRSVIPLLQPVEHQLPFAAALLVHHLSSKEDPSSSVDPNHSDAHQQTTSLVELSYVLSGSGHFISKSGETQLVSAGDSILAVLGEISFAAGSPPTAAAVARSAATADIRSSSSSSKEQPIGGHWMDSITWLKHHTTIPQPQNLLNQHHHHHQQQQQQHVDARHFTDANLHTGMQQQLVMLQLLLPSELLTGELDHHHPYHLQQVEQQSPWAYAVQQQQQGSQSSSRIDQRSVCQLLSGAFGPPGLSEPQQQQQQQQQQRDLALLWSGSSSGGHQAATSGSNALTDNGNGFNLNHSSSSSINSPQRAGGRAISSNGTTSSSSSLPALGDRTSNGTTSGSSLPALSEQARSCVKRTLADVKAFQLPAQTNRLALLFGPHASPAVCLSFGVEVFEPGHVTPLHIHDNAHELFFVLAGNGVGVHGPGPATAVEQPDLQQQQQQDFGGAEHADQQQQQQQQHDGMSGGAISCVQRVDLSAGDVAVFPPGVLHGVDNPTDQQLYCLQMMLPNDSFVEWVRSGQTAGALDVAALQQLAAAASCGAQ